MVILRLRFTSSFGRISVVLSLLLGFSHASPPLSHQCVCCPMNRATYVTAHGERDVVYNLIPTYSFVNLHIDYGADGISKTVGSCEKYWFLFP